MAIQTYPYLGICVALFLLLVGLTALVVEGSASEAASEAAGSGRGADALCPSRRRGHDVPHEELEQSSTVGTGAAGRGGV